MKLLKILLLLSLLLHQSCAFFQGDESSETETAENDSENSADMLSDTSGEEGSTPVDATDQNAAQSLDEFDLEGEEVIQDKAKTSGSELGDIKPLDELGSTNMGDKTRNLANSSTTNTTTAPVITPMAANSYANENYNSSINTSGDLRTYTVESNETLMLIAFKLYGDYRKWKELKKWNQNIVRSSNALAAGTMLKYYPPAEEFNWRPEGEAYLIRRGDTLGKISHKVYGTRKHWKHLWENNKPLIRDPHLIFAGFTLYYKELSSLAKL